MDDLRTDCRVCEVLILKPISKPSSPSDKLGLVRFENQEQRYAAINRLGNDLRASISVSGAHSARRLFQQLASADPVAGGSLVRLDHRSFGLPDTDGGSRNSRKMNAFRLSSL